jgi:hypothetical protein
MEWCSDVVVAASHQYSNNLDEETA